MGVPPVRIPGVEPKGLHSIASSITAWLPIGSSYYTIYGVHGHCISSGFPAAPITVSRASPPVKPEGLTAAQARSHGAQRTPQLTAAFTST